MHDKIKKQGQASMEYILVLSIILLVFMMVMYLVYEKNVEIIETKTYLDAKSVTNTIVSNINTISEQGNGYYKTFTIPSTLYGGYDYTITIEGNTVELRWGIRPYTYAKSPITANVRGFVVKDLNKVLNCAGDIYVGYPPISCTEAAANLIPNITILYPVSGALNCTPFVINGTAVDVNGRVMRVEVSINGGLWWLADNVVPGNETNWTYPFTPAGDETYVISARATDIYGALSSVKTVTVSVDRCSDLIPLGGTFVPAGDVRTGTVQPVSINVQNQGVGSSRPFAVKLDIKNSGGITLLNYTQNFGGLGAGGTGTVSTTWNVPPAVDNYTAVVTVDSGGAVTETNELNNNFSRSFSSTTFPPESVINYPAQGSTMNYTVIKSGMNITGTASDDGWITKVNVTISRAAGYYNGSFDASINVTGSNATWNYAWVPPEYKGVYTICSLATDNNGYRQTNPYCINVTIPCPGNWWNRSLNYRRAINLSVSSGSTPQDYQVNIILNSSNVGNNFSWSINCSSVRFVDNNGIILSYWVENCDPGNRSASLWVKVNGNITTTPLVIYMYYGNSSFNSTSNAVNTMFIYEDMESAPTGTLSGSAFYNYTSKWLRLTDNVTNSVGYIYYTKNPGPGFHAKFRFFTGGGSGADAVWAGVHDTAINETREDIVKGGYHFTYDEYNDRIAFTKNTTDNGGSIAQSNDTTIDNSAWRSAEIYFYNSGTTAAAQIYLDGALRVNGADNSPQSTAGNYFSFGGRTGGGTNFHRIDDVIVVKYVSPEPTVSLQPQEMCGI